MSYPSLTEITTLKAALRRADITPARSWGQHFLICKEVIEATLLLANEGPRLVTELGAGAGTVTQALLAKGFTVRAIEKDRALAAILPDFVTPATRPQLTLVIGDLRSLSWEHATPYQLIGNIPYTLSGLIIRRLTHLTPPPRQAIMLVQAEVADRLTAAPPAMHLLSVVVGLWGKAEHVLSVPPSCFWPAPTVASALVRLTPHTRLLPLEEREAVLQLARRCFQERRKQLGGILRRLFPTVTITAADWEALGLAPTVRPQALTIRHWIALREFVASK